jgi:hypothetical protein
MLLVKHSSRSAAESTTATVANISAITTFPKFGSEASITNVARPAAYTPSASGTPIKGIAADRSAELNCWTGVVFRILGMGVVGSSIVEHIDKEAAC